MGQIAGVFWIIFGLLYILYQYFLSTRHNKAQAAMSAAFVILCVFGIITVSLVTNSGKFALFSLMLFLAYRYKVNADKSVSESQPNSDDVLKMSDSANRVWREWAPFLWSFSIMFLSFDATDITNPDIAIAIILSALSFWVVALYRSRDRS